MRLSGSGIFVFVVVLILSLGALVGGCYLLGFGTRPWLDYLRQAQKEILAGNQAKADKLIEMALNEARKQGGCPQPLTRLAYSQTFAEDLRLVARAYRAQGKLYEAEKLFKVATEMNQKCNAPDYLTNRCLQDLADLYRSTQRMAEAEALYDSILRRVRDKEPQVASEILLLRAKDRLRYKDLRDAERFYKEACSYEEQGGTISPITARIDLAEFYKDHGRWKESEGIYRKLLAESAKDARWSPRYVLYQLGELYRACSRVPDAEQVYQQVVTNSQEWEQSTKALALTSLAEVYDARGAYDQASSHYEQAIGLLDKTSAEPKLECLRRYASFLRRHKRIPDALKVESDIRFATEEQKRQESIFKDYINP